MFYNYPYCGYGPGCGYGYRRHYNHGYYPYGTYGYPLGYQYNLLNSQLSSVNQNLYNSGFMNGVTQSSIVNQLGGFY